MRFPAKPFLLALLLALMGQASAQFNSPYSQFGIGRLRDQSFAINRALGGMAVPWRDITTINFINPASYSAFYTVDTTGVFGDSALTYKVTSLQAGLFADALTARNATEDSRSGNASLGYLAFGFPIVKAGGISVGLVPYSHVDYHLVSEDHSDTIIGTKSTIYLGSGNLYKTYLGIGVKRKAFSIGVNAWYMFGNLDYSRILWFPDQANSIGIRERVKHYTSGAGWDGGIQYETGSLVFGVIGSAPLSLGVSTDTITDRVLVADNESFAHLDSLQSTLGADNSLQLPLTVGFGIGYRAQRKRTGEDNDDGGVSRLFAGADFIWQKWSATNGLLTRPSDDAWRLAAGVSYTPQAQVTLPKKLIQRTTYRFGVHYGTQYMLLNGKSVSDMGVSFGFGIPLVQTSEMKLTEASKLPASLDLSFDIGRAGNVGSNLVSESYFKFTLGLNLNNNFWLFKTKID